MGKGCKITLICAVVLLVAGGIAGGVTYAVMKNKAKDDPVKSYSEAIKIAVQFLDIQKSGKLVNNKIPWRGDSALEDGSEAKIDLSKGMYDAGDNMKFGMPMAYTATILSWSILEYGETLKKENQLKNVQDSVKWITDWLINAHADDNVLYVQVGDPDVEHKCWQQPESITEDRPLAEVNTSAPGSDVAAESAAALAAASLVFKKDDAKYSADCLKHAQTLFKFADKYRGIYSDSVPSAAKYYNSTGFTDELLWAAGWLYHATGDKKYFKFVTGPDSEDASLGKPTFFTWDNKNAGTQVLLSRLNYFDSSSTVSGDDKIKSYKETAESVMCMILPKSPSATDTRTEGGILHVSEFNSLLQPISSSFLAVLYSDYMEKSSTSTIKCGSESFKPEDLRDFAKQQTSYVLGDNPMQMSYLVGYGSKFPQQVHHRGASIPSNEKPDCKEGIKWSESKNANPNQCTGAVVGGPDKDDQFVDKRKNYKQTEPTTYSNALFVGLLSSLVVNADVPKSFT